MTKWWIATRLRLTLGLAALGMLVAVAFAAYFGIGDPKPDGLAALWAGGAALILCPGSLLFVWIIDAEPGTSGFVFVWLMAALINAGLYGAIGSAIGMLLRKREG